MLQATKLRSPRLVTKLLRSPGASGSPGLVPGPGPGLRGPGYFFAWSSPHGLPSLVYEGSSRMLCSTSLVYDVPSQVLCSTSVAPLDGDAPVCTVLRILLWRDVRLLSDAGSALASSTISSTRGSLVSAAGSANGTGPGVIVSFPSAFEELASASKPLPPPGASSMLNGAPVHCTFRTRPDTIFVCSIFWKSML